MTGSTTGSTQQGSQDAPGGELSARLQRCLRSIFEALNHEVNYCVIRNYESLFERPGMDVDLLSDSPNEIREICRRQAADHQLALIDRATSAGCQILLLDFHVSDQHRLWLLFDVQTRYTYDRTRAMLLGSEVAATSMSHPSLGVRIPTPGAEFLLLLSHIVSKGHTKTQYLERLRLLVSEHFETVEVFLTNRGLPGETLKQWGEAIGRSELDEETVRRIRSQLDSLPVEDIPRHSATQHETVWLLRQTLSRLAKLTRTRWVLRYVRRPAKRPWLLILLGADGVGKTTLSVRLAELFRRYPVCVSSHHHLKGPQEPAASEGEQPGPPVGGIASPKWWQALRRRVEGFLGVTGGATQVDHRNSRRVVGSLYRAIVLMRVESRFADLWRRWLREYGQEPRIAIVDRWYPISRRSDFAAKGGAPWYLRICTYLLGMGAVRPDFYVLIQDDPAAVVERKQELTVEEVARYQAFEDRLVERNHLPHLRLRFSYDTDSLCQAIIQESFRVLGEGAFPLVAEYDVRRDERLPPPPPCL